MRAIGQMKHEKVVEETYIAIHTGLALISQSQRPLVASQLVPLTLSALCFLCFVPVFFFFLLLSFLRFLLVLASPRVLCFGIV